MNKYYVDHYRTGLSLLSREKCAALDRGETVVVEWQEGPGRVCSREIKREEFGPWAGEALVAPVRG